MSHTDSIRINLAPRTRVLAVSVAASLALHVLALLALPHVHRDARAQVEVLEVRLVAAPEAPRVLPVAPEPAREAAVTRKRKRPQPAATDSKPQRPRSAPREERPREEPSRSEPPQLLTRSPQAESEWTVPARPPAERVADPSASSTPAAAPVPGELAGSERGSWRGSESGAAEKATPPSFNAAYLRNPPPRYPVSARRNGEQGTVTLRVLVTRDGLPQTITLETTSGSSALDRAALDAVKAWRFVPARQDGQAVEAWVLVPIVFRLEGAS